MSKILIIEDDHMLRRQVAQLLALEGFEPREASNGRAGVELARAEVPDLVVCDIMMPELDGFGVLQELRQSHATASLPFIFLTAKVESRDLRQGMNLGADDYLTKPFNPDELLTSVRQRLNRRQQQLQEITLRTEELSLALASVLPAEFAEPMDHIETVANLMVIQHGSTVPQLAEMQRSLAAATARVRRMAQRLNLFAQLPQLYANRFELQHTSFLENAGDIVRREADSVAARWQRSADLTFSVEDSGLAMQENYLAIVCQELVENACKFSPSGTPIEVAVGCCQDSWSLEVANSGPGLQPDEIAGIGAFKQFWTGLRKPAGLGLGLVLVQGILRLHGGETVIESQPGKSTVVRVLLPVETVPNGNFSAIEGVTA